MCLYRMLQQLQGKICTFMCLVSRSGHKSPWVVRKTFQVWAIHFFLKVSMKFHCTTFNPSEQRVTQPLIFVIQILYVNNQLVMSPIVSLRNSTKRKFIIMYSARSTTVWMCHKKKELALRQLKRNMFNHNLIFKKDLAYSPKVHMWWLVSIEGEGQYCLICKKFESKNPQNKKEFFFSNPKP